MDYNDDRTGAEPVPAAGYSRSGTETGSIAELPTIDPHATNARAERVRVHIETPGGTKRPFDAAVGMAQRVLNMAAYGGVQRDIATASPAAK